MRSPNYQECMNVTRRKLRQTSVKIKKSETKGGEEQRLHMCRFFLFISLNFLPSLKSASCRSRNRKFHILVFLRQDLFFFYF